jgi:glutathione-regulated potassium-efflux system ancillary protein KefC
MDGNLLLAIFVLLAATVALVPLAKWAGLGTVLGYLAAGILIGPYGLGLVSDTDTIHEIADFGIVMMLFLIGLELHPADLWRMRNQVMGLGLTQIVATTVVLSGVAMVIGFSWQAALIIGLALSMSSTAIAMQSVAQRSLSRSDTGRASLAVLLVQDVAVIPILAIIPVLVVMTGSPVAGIAEGAVEVVEDVVSPRGWVVAAYIVGGFAAAILLSRFAIRPLMHFVAVVNVREAFLALALLLVVGAALLAGELGLSPALGAFLGGVLLADSEYRHELESNLAPFKDLLLGLFFISVGMSIAFSVVIEQPLFIVALVVLLVGIKLAVLFTLATFFRMQVAERLLFAILLSQAGEFAFVILQFAQSSGRFTGDELELLKVVVALSMATTPILLFLFDRIWGPKLEAAAATDDAPGPDAIETQQSVIVLGYGRFGQIVTRLLRARGYRMTLIDDDPAQIALVKRFGVKVFYGDGARLEILRAAGAAEAKMVVIAVAGAERITAMAEVIRRNFPDVIIAARAVDRSHAHELMALGVHVFERETFRAAIRLGERALVALGHSEEEANHIATAFEKHDVRMLLDSFAVRHDQAAYVGFVRRSTEMLEQVMRADLQNAKENRRRVAEAVESDEPDAPSEATAEPPVLEDPDLDKEVPAESDRR